MKTPFKLKSGNTSSFKNMGSSPAKQKTDPTAKPWANQYKKEQFKKILSKDDKGVLNKSIDALRSTKAKATKASNAKPVTYGGKTRAQSLSDQRKHRGINKTNANMRANTNMKVNANMGKNVAKKTIIKKAFNKVVPVVAAADFVHSLAKTENKGKEGLKEFGGRFLAGNPYLFRNDPNKPKGADLIRKKKQQQLYKAHEIPGKIAQTLYKNRKGLAKGLSESGKEISKKVKSGYGKLKNYVRKRK